MTGHQQDTYASSRRTFSLLGLVLWVIVCICFAFPLVMVLYVLLRFATSDYTSSIFKFFIWNLWNKSTPICNFAQSGQFHHWYFFFFKIFDNLSTYQYKWLLLFWMFVVLVLVNANIWSYDDMSMIVAQNKNIAIIVIPNLT